MLAGQKIPDDIIDHRNGGTKTLLVSLRRLICKKKENVEKNLWRFNLFFRC